MMKIGTALNTVAKDVSIIKSYTAELKNRYSWMRRNMEDSVTNMIL